MGPAIEFVHLHLYRAEPRFRAHVGLRAWDDPFEAVALTGPASHPTDQYRMIFADDESSVEACADAITRYCRDVGEPWWRINRVVGVLTGSESPLDAKARRAFDAALHGHTDPTARARTRSLLGVV
jgi:hypothetical protein